MNIAETERLRKHLDSLPPTEANLRKVAKARGRCASARIKSLVIHEGVKYSWNGETELMTARFLLVETEHPEDLGPVKRLEIFLETGNSDIPNEVVKETAGIRNQMFEDKKSLEKKLFSALGNEDKKKILECVVSGADLNIRRGEDKRTPLMMAAECYPKMISFLVLAGANPNMDDGHGVTPLMVAAKHKPECVFYLLAAGADPNVKDKNGRTPLMLAAEWHPEAVVSLLAAGADPNAKGEEDWTSLMYAAKYQPEAVAYLLDAGADPNVKGEDGRTPLMLAAGWHPEAVVSLLAGGADPNAKTSAGWTPLHFATKYQPEAVTYLLAAGATVNERGNCGWTALMLAAKYHPETIKAIEEAGADLDAKNDKGWTSLMFAAMRGLEAMLDLISVADPNMMNEDGKTAGDIAVKQKKFEAFAEWSRYANKALVVDAMKKNTENGAAAALALLSSEKSPSRDVLQIAEQIFSSKVVSSIDLFLSNYRVLHYIDFHRFLKTISSSGVQQVSLCAAAIKTLADGMFHLLSDAPDTLDFVVSAMEKYFSESFEEHKSDNETSESIDSLIRTIASLSGEKEESEIIPCL